MSKSKIHWLSAFSLLLATGMAAADNPASEATKPYVLQGSSTFAHGVMELYQPAIEKTCGHKLTVLPSKSSRGLLALFKKSGDFAMISGPLQKEVDDLKIENPDLPYARLQAFNIANTRVAFAVNRANPLRQITDENLRRILLGEVTNWRYLGGDDLPIKIIMVRDGGGVAASIEAEFLAGKHINAMDPLVVQISPEVLKITAMVPGALALSQLNLLKGADVAELKMEHPVAQQLALVTLGDPTPEMRKVIDAAREVMSTASE